MGVQLEAVERVIIKGDTPGGHIHDPQGTAKDIVQNFVKIERRDDDLGHRKDFAQAIQFFVGKFVLAQYFLELGKPPDAQCESSLSGKQLTPNHREHLNRERLLKTHKLLTHPPRNAKNQIDKNRTGKPVFSRHRPANIFFRFLLAAILTRTTYCGLTLAEPHHLVELNANIQISLSY